MQISTSLKQFAAMLAFIIPAFALLLLGCSGSGNSGTTDTGTLTLRITDAQVDTAEHVYVQFHGLEIQSASGVRTTLSYCQDPADATRTIVSSSACSTPAAPRHIDLLALGGGLAETLLNGYVLPAGSYSWIRLMVDTAGIHDSYIVLQGGAAYELTIPSGSETGLKLNRSINIPAGGGADFTIDFDLRKSVHVAGMGNYMLRPTLRMVDNSMVGAIAGTVAPSLITPGCTPAVYVYSGAGVTADDIDGFVPDPVTTASVKLDSGSGKYHYHAAFLEAGDYTVAFTCQAAADDPAANDALTFNGTATVAVTASAVTPHDF